MKNRLATFVALAGSAVTATSALAQAPASNQVWQIRYVIERYDQFGALIDTGTTQGGTTAAQSPGSPAFASDAGYVSVNSIPTGGRYVSRVDVTIQTRVGLTTATSASTTNLNRNGGVTFSGGTGSAAPTASEFKMLFVDALSTNASIARGTLARARTNETNTFTVDDPDQPDAATWNTAANGGVSTILNDSQTPFSSWNTAGSNTPLEGTFGPFRAGFTPAGDYGFGDNTFTGNGRMYNDAGNLNPGVTNIANARQSFNQNASQTAIPNYSGTATVTAGALGAIRRTANSLGGTLIFAEANSPYANIYKMSYTPRAADFGVVTPGGVDGCRTINVGVQNFSVAYNYAGPAPFSPSNFLNLTNAGNVNGLNFSFVVPTPGSATLIGLAGIAALRRRRA